MNVWSQTLGRLVRIIQSCGANLILMKYCEKYIHIPHACAGLMFPLGGSRGVASISMSRLLRTPDVCSALTPFISRAEVDAAMVAMMDDLNLAASRWPRIISL